ncbi:MAG: sensor histidine kinase, partial [Alistipes sp.]|nr:sensor histidine kinase [Alistipes sp.]
MVKEILLILSVILQIIAAIVAIGLTRRTKYNLSWMLFTVALSCMACLRLGEYIQITSLKEWRLPAEFFAWSGIITSLCFAVGVLLVQKIFNYVARTEMQRRMSERRILNTILRTEEKERQRFSKDLHDGLGPLL